MKSYRIDSPCSPGDNVYLLCNDGVRCLYVRELQVFGDYKSGSPITAVLFANYPYIVLTDETRKRFFGNKDDAVKAFKKFDDNAT